MNTKTLQAILTLKGLECRCGAKYKITEVKKITPFYYWIYAIHDGSNKYGDKLIYSIQSYSLLIDGMTKFPEEIRQKLLDKIERGLKINGQI